MRVISGIAKGRKLDAVPGTGTRPITDRVKTALFDTIRPRLQEARMLDLFAGSGAVGIEALSQGAAHCTFLDLSRAAVLTIEENTKRTGFSEQAVIRNVDAFRFLKGSKDRFDLIYVAPPQYKNLWVEAMHAIAERPELVSDIGFVIVQIDPREYEKLDLKYFTEVQERKYGNTLLLFFEPVPRVLENEQQ